MHMAQRRMAGWMQEMEREGEEGEILDHSCVRIEKKSCFEAQRNILLFFPPDRKEAEEQFATARVKCGCGGDSCAVSISAITSSHFVFMCERP